jgi:hypothetical protein
MLRSRKDRGHERCRARSWTCTVPTRAAASPLRAGECGDSHRRKSAVPRSDVVDARRVMFARIMGPAVPWQPEVLRRCRGLRFARVRRRHWCLCHDRLCWTCPRCPRFGWHAARLRQASIAKGLWRGYDARDRRLRSFADARARANLCRIMAGVPWTQGRSRDPRVDPTSRARA